MKDVRWALRILSMRSRKSRHDLGVPSKVREETLRGMELARIILPPDYAPLEDTFQAV